MNGTLGQSDCQPLARFWQMLTKEICAGHPLGSTLESIAVELDGTHLRGVVRELTAGVRAGQPLSQAMRQRPEVFRQHVTLLVDGGERAGILDRVLLLILEHVWRCPECIRGQDG